MWGNSSGRIGPALWQLLLTSTMLTGVTASAHAADASGGSTIETVVVTAEKRSEDIQQAPLSITALTTKKLEELNISDFADYVKFLPSVTYTVGGAGGGNAGPSFANVSMRGVSSGNDGNHSGSLPTVGIYLDEQPITTIGGALDVHVYDIARVESLAGPQGTLYGASSEAGTIRIITNKPDPSGFSAAYDVDVNTDHGGWGYGGEGFVNIPLADDMAIRLVGFSEHDSGYIDNVLGTRTFPSSGITVSNASLVKNNFNSTDSYGGRAALEFDLDADWTITPTVIAQHTQTSGVFGFDPSVGDLKVQHFFPEYTHDTWVQTALTIQGKLANLDVTYSGGYMDRQINAASDYTDYGYLYDTIYGIGTYFYDNHGNLINPAQYILEKDHFTKMSHELRVSTPGDYWLRFVGGLFYETQNHYILQNYQIAGLADENADPGIPQLSVPGWPGTIWLTDQERHDTDYAIFGEVSADLFQGFTLTLGGRGFIAHNSLKGFFGFSDAFSSHTGVAKCFAPTSVDAGPCTNLDQGVTEGGFTHKINATYHIDDDRMVYATWSTGFRPGGINRRGGIPPYKPDRLTNYELGVKSSWFDDHLVFDAAVYREDWNNFQFSFLGANSFTEIHNAGAARIYGWEANVTAQPMDGLTINGSASYNDSHLTKPYCGPVGVTVCPAMPGTPFPLGPEAPVGTPLPTPKFKTNWTARYEFPLDEFTAHIQGSVIHQSNSIPDIRLFAPDPINSPAYPAPNPVLDPVRSLLGTQRAYTSADFTLGLDAERWALELFIKNAFDTRADLYNYAECATQVCGYEPYEVPSQPRTIGLKFSQKFD